MARGPLHICWRCKSNTKPLRAKTFFQPGSHETFYSCYGCHNFALGEANKRHKEKRLTEIREPWEDLSPVPFTGADPELDAQLAREEQERGE